MIPPAWTDVWIAPSRKAHILATGREQYLYHPDWSEAAGDLKFSRMKTFSRHLPSLRRRVEADLRRRELDQGKVAAIAVRVLDQTLIRVGNRRYATENGSFGLTTLEADHVEVSGSRVEFEFTGKGGAEHNLTIHDRRLATLVTRCQDLSGDTLFSFQDGDQVVSLTPGHLNDYIAGLGRNRFTAKDFRTWGASAAVTEAGNRRVRIGSRRSTLPQSDFGNTAVCCSRMCIRSSKRPLPTTVEKARQSRDAAGSIARVGAPSSRLSRRLRPLIQAGREFELASTCSVSRSRCRSLATGKSVA